MWIDISQTLKTGIATWPGDQPFVYQMDSQLEDQTGANVGSIKMSLHTGTHLDAPFHYDHEGVTIDKIDINRLIGDAQVIEFIDEDVVTQTLLQDIVIDKPIVLFKSVYSKDQSVFSGDFMTFESDAIHYLASLGVEVIGTDMPSIDTVDNETLDAHKACLENQILIIENLELNKVRVGDYDFIGMPLKIEADASPIRAVVKKKL